GYQMALGVSARRVVATMQLGITGKCRLPAWPPTSTPMSQLQDGLRSSSTKAMATYTLRYRTGTASWWLSVSRLCPAASQRSEMLAPCAASPDTMANTMGLKYIQ